MTLCAGNAKIDGDVGVVAMRKRSDIPASTSSQERASLEIRPAIGLFFT